MNKQTIGWMFAATIAVLPALASAEDARKAMEVQQKAFEKAILTKDVAWFEKTAAPDYHETSEKGIVTKRKEALAMMKMMLESGGTKKVEGKILKAWTKGKYTMCLSDVRMVMDMKQPGAKKADTYDSAMRMEETWSKVGGKWQLHHIKTVSSKTLMNGKPMPGGMG